MLSAIKRSIFLFALILLGIIYSPAQLPGGYTEVKLAYGSDNYLFGFGSRSDCWIRGGGGIYDEAKLKPLLTDKECAETIKALNINFTKQTLVGWSAHSDCHMSVRIKVFRSAAEKKYLVIINNIYGGCRAGGSRSGWIVLDKIPADYTLEMKEVRVDRIHGINDDGKDFYFPKQPSGIKPVEIESREIEVKGCLPLDRQSQWILIKDEFLQTALEGKSGECKELFKALAIDFDKYTLAGYNVLTNGCSGPRPFTQKVYKDFDEKRYRMEITTNKTGSRDCDALAYHPLWVLVPKLPGDHGFVFELKPKELPKPRQ